MTLQQGDLKVILLGDSAVGKSKLLERYLMDQYEPVQLSTFALTLFRKTTVVDGTSLDIDFWDTAGQERFNKMHPAFYDKAHACVLVFDVTRKSTYQHLVNWYSELREFCEHIPCILVANKIDEDYKVTRKNFKFASQNDLPFFFVSAADGTNVVKALDEAVRCGLQYKQSGRKDFVGEVRDLLSNEIP